MCVVWLKQNVWLMIYLNLVVSFINFYLYIIKKKCFKELEKYWMMIFTRFMDDSESVKETKKFFPGEK